MDWISIALKLAIVVVAGVIAHFMFGGSNFGMISVVAAVAVSGYFVFFNQKVSNAIGGVTSPGIASRPASTTIPVTNP